MEMSHYNESGNKVYKNCRNPEGEDQFPFFVKETDQDEASHYYVFVCF